MKDILKNLIEAILQNCGGASPETIKFTQDNVDLISEMFKYFAFIGIAMTLVYFLMEMNRKFALEGGDLTIKSFFAPFLKLMIAIAVLSQGGKIIGAILSMNNAMAEAAGGVWENGKQIKAGWFSFKTDNKLEEVANFLSDEVNAMGILKLVSVIIPLLLGFVISLVLKLVWWFKGLVYRLEAMFRLGVAPVALADVYSGQNSNAIRYLKGFLALGLYGMALVALPILAMNLAVVDVADGASFWDGFANFCQLAFVAPFAALSCASAAKQIAKEALGA